MKKYSQYSVEDFVLDDGFRMWTLNEDLNQDSFWRGWVLTHPDMKPVVSEARQIILGLQHQQAQVNQEEIEAGFQEVEAYFDKVMNRQNKRFSRSTWWMAASVLALVFAGMGILFQQQQGGKEKQHITEEGEHDKVLLPDGSRVYMKENSHLTYSADWNKSQERNVTIQGEAYFQVSEQIYQGKKIKFVVKAHGLSVEVVGTEFVVRNRGSKTHVALNSGKIRLKMEESNRVLNMTPGDVIEYDASNHTLSSHRKNEGTGNSWIKNFEQAGQPASKPSSGSKNNRGVTRGVRIEPGLPSGTIPAGSKAQNQQSVAVKKARSSSLDEGRKAVSSSTHEDPGIYGSSVSYRKHGGSMADGSQHYIVQPVEPGNTEASNNLSESTQKGNDNMAYIEQIGDNLTSKQDQKGSRNQASASIQGQKDSNDELEWSTWQQQQGSQNVSIFNLVKSYNSNMYSSQQGQNNRVQASSRGENNQAVILQEGLENQVLIEQYGISNDAAGMAPLEPGILQRGSFNEAHIIQQGTGNQTRNIQHGQNNEITVNQKGK